LEAIEAAFCRLAGDVLGILPDGLDQEVGSPKSTSGELTDGLVRLLIEMRQEARAARDWSRADAIRDRLAQIGITLEDGPEGTRWRLSR
jgi:cysteinyl-tRNA synthetase